MNCPICDGIRMKEVDKDGITIDICPQCKGIWLDRGELDKLMSGIHEIRNEFNEWHQERYKDSDRGHYAGKYNDPYYRKKRKKNFLERIEDFFD